ncbi:hypothetical protein CRE_14517 [Caenorhabditis remanei]|uniref:GATA-type domain-containing protein n=1 Tax=Caenorhabditis remanei TaxID=31234 RepID=E3M9C1_CAERE|nr:hypothetical protein CRE_14517 [Caenorhabditis remanei]
MNNQSLQQNENVNTPLNPEFLNGFIRGAEMMRNYLQTVSSVMPPQLQVAPLVPTTGLPYSMASATSQAPPITNLNSADQSKITRSIDNRDEKKLLSSPKEMDSSSPRTTKLKSCSHCKVTESCCWRKVRSDAGMMCNACFIYERKYKKSRPLSAIKKHNAMTEHN